MRAFPVHPGKYIPAQHVPSISTLEAICDGFGITMSQFFTDGDLTVLTPEQKELFDKWVALTPEQKSAVYGLIAAFTDHS